MKAEIKRLTAENAKLKYENQQLRKMLGQPENKTVPTVPAGGQIFKTNTESSVTSSDQQETGYWMTISSGKRHNKTCRYYKGSKGRFCKPDEGVACKICGG
jgi:cell shape-determining protein MreC